MVFDFCIFPLIPYVSLFIILYVCVCSDFHHAPISNWSMVFIFISTVDSSTLTILSIYDYGDITKKLVRRDLQFLNEFLFFCIARLIVSWCFFCARHPLMFGFSIMSWKIIPVQINWEWHFVYICHAVLCQTKNRNIVL